MTRLYSIVLLISALTFIVAWQLYGFLVGSGVGVLMLVQGTVLLIWLAKDDAAREQLGLVGDDQLAREKVSAQIAKIEGGAQKKIERLKARIA